MMKVGVSNVNGGVAKTTNTINLSGAAAAKGLDTLAVDCDPQGYLTQNLGFRDEFTRREGPSFYDAWMDHKEVDVTEIIVEHEEGFDVLPANAAMFKLRRDLLADSYQLGKRLEQILEGLPDYDLVIVDASPDLGMITAWAQSHATNELWTTRPGVGRNRPEPGPIQTLNCLLAAGRWCHRLARECGPRPDC